MLDEHRLLLGDAVNAAAAQRQAVNGNLDNLTVGIQALVGSNRVRIAVVSIARDDDGAVGLVPLVVVTLAK